MMKKPGQVRIVLLSAAALVAAPGAVKSDSIQTPGPARVYGLRIATATPGRLNDLQALFRDRAARLSRYAIEPIFSGTVLEGAASDGDRAMNMLVDIPRTRVAPPSTAPGRLSRPIRIGARPGLQLRKADLCSSAHPRLRS